jgi:hypothetical protein
VTYLIREIWLNCSSFEHQRVRELLRFCQIWVVVICVELTRVIALSATLRSTSGSKGRRWRGTISCNSTAVLRLLYTWVLLTGHSEKLRGASEDALFVVPTFHHQFVSRNHLVHIRGRIGSAFP